MSDLMAKIVQRDGVAGGERTSRDAILPGTGAARRHENRLLASLPPSDLALFARHLHVVSLQPGAVLQHQDHPVEHAHFPHEGIVSLLATTPDGESMEAASVGRGGAVGPLFKSDACACLFTAVAQTTMRVSRIAAAHLQTARRESEVLDRALRACGDVLLYQLRQNIACGGLHAVEQRLSRWLLEAADRLESDAISIPVTQEQVAQRLGVRRTTVTLLAGKLQDVGAIHWGRSRVDIRDHARLEAMACSCYRSLRGYTCDLPSA